MTLQEKVKIMLSPSERFVYTIATTIHEFTGFSLAMKVATRLFYIAVCRTRISITDVDISEERERKIQEIIKLKKSIEDKLKKI